MSITIADTELLDLTPALARKFHGMRAMPGERVLQPKRTNWIRTLLARGAFYAPRWATAKHGRTEFRVDGQHTSHVLTELANTDQRSFPKGLLAIVDRFKVDSLEDLAELYDYFNNPVSGRSSKDKLTFFLGYFGQEHPELEGCDIALTGYALTGMSVAIMERERATKGREGATGGKLSARDRGHLLDPHAADGTGIPFVVWCQKLKGTPNGGKFLRIPGLASQVYEQWCENKKSATTFWQHVMREDHPDPDHETRELARKVHEWSGTKHAKQMHRFIKAASRTWKIYRKSSRLTAA